MPRWIIIVFELCCVPCLAFGQQSLTRYTIEAKETQKVTGTMTYEVNCKNMQAKEWLLFVAQAPELPSQSNVKTVLSSTATPLRELSLQARPLLATTVPARTTTLLTEVSIKATYSATLKARELKPLALDAKPSAISALTVGERRIYTSDLPDIDFNNPIFKKWMETNDLLRKKDERDLDFARRVFLALRKSFKYEYVPNSSRKAPAVCQAGKSDCGGLSVLYVALMRANKIPARIHYGRWAKSAIPNDKLNGVPYFQWHVKAEVYCDTIGWVPLDLSSGITHDTTEEGLKYFGKCAGDFITFHIDPSISVVAGTFGKQPIHSLQLPMWWVTGKGSVDGAKVSENWQVTAEPIQK